MDDIDRIIHEPARLRVLTLLSGVDAMDFTFILNALGLTRGNLSSHMDKLEKAGYITVEKGFNGKVPQTTYAITENGISNLADYWRSIEEIRSLTKDRQPTKTISHDPMHKDTRSLNDESKMNWAPWNS